MYSLKHAFIYLHVSKTGGNSIQQILLPFSEDKKVVSGHQDGVDRFGLTGSITPEKHAFLERYEQACPGISKQNQVIISVRDPYLRALSGYFSPHRWMQPAQNGGFEMRPPEWSKTAFLAYLDSGQLPAATDWLRLAGAVAQPDHVIRFETIEEDLARTTRALGLNVDVSGQMPHVNKTAETGTLKQELAQDLALRDLVLDRYKEDADQFGYG
ncbi:sulfotransferase family 2 domain-containing protein [Thalassobius sp. S69A]|uniref:sulfotransferase family 2 domain-containing protein n=1 Tax=unclassified Thalassovita TaxID=2619711 RepID=UPI003C7E1B2E